MNESLNAIEERLRKLSSKPSTLDAMKVMGAILSASKDGLTFLCRPGELVVFETGVKGDLAYGVVGKPSNCVIIGGSSPAAMVVALVYAGRKIGVPGLDLASMLVEFAKATCPGYHENEEKKS